MSFAEVTELETHEFNEKYYIILTETESRPGKLIEDDIYFVILTDTKLESNKHIAVYNRETDELVYEEDTNNGSSRGLTKHFNITFNSEWWEG